MHSHKHEKGKKHHKVERFERVRQKKLLSEENSLDVPSRCNCNESMAALTVHAVVVVVGHGEHRIVSILLVMDPEDSVELRLDASSSKARPIGLPRRAR